MGECDGIRGVWGYVRGGMGGISNAIASGGQSVVGNQNLVTKVYFPRLAIPISTVAA